MTQGELFAFTYLFGFALLFSVGSVLGLAALLQLERSIGRWVAASVVPGMALAIAAGTLLSNRDLKYAYANIGALGLNPLPGGAMLLRTITAIIVGLAVASIIARLFGKPRGQTAIAAAPGLPGLPGQMLLVTFLLFYISNELLNSALGTYPSFSHNTLYVPLVFVAVYMSRNEPAQAFARSAKLALLGLMVLSLLAAVALPALALEPNYKGWVPGLTVRLWGVGSNANSIGPLALLLMLLELYCPSTTRLGRCLVWGLALAVLLLAQSKTALLAGLLITPIVAWYRIGRHPTGGVRIGFVLGLLAVLIAVLLGLMFGNLDKLWARLAVGQVGDQISSLSGRVQIWNAAINAWRDNPLFGYGPLAWGPLHRATIGMPYAFSAHNQFLQSLSVAGGLGLATLLIFLAALGIYAWRAAEMTSGMTLALFALVFIRCFTETPFATGNLFTGEAVALLVLFRLALLGGRQTTVRNKLSLMAQVAIPA